MRHRGWKLGAVVVLLASLARPCASLAQGALPDPTLLQAKGLFEALEYAQAHWLAAGMVAFAFIVLFVLYTLSPAGRRT